MSATGSLCKATAQELLTSVAEPENPEERDAAWNEIARRDALLQAAAEAFNTGDYDVMEEALRFV